MTTYMYIARDTEGARREGVVQAQSPNEAIGALHQRGLTPTSIEETFAQKKRKERLVGKGRIKPADMAALCWQLSTMVEGGMAITTAIEIVAGDTSIPQLKTILHRVLVNVTEGRPLSDGLKEFPQVFSKLSVAIILAGESSGNLGHALHTLAEHFENKDRLAKKIRSALAYPVFVLIMIGLMITAIMVFVVPRFRAIFDQLGGKLPTFTQTFMHAHELAGQNAVYLLVAAAVVIGGIAFWSKTQHGHRIMSRALLKIPLFGRLFSEAFVATFCSTTATLLEAGVPVLEVFEIVRGMTTNDVIGSAIARARHNIMGGSNIASSMGAAGFFPNMVVKMTQVGEESGSLASILRKTSGHYERRITATIDALTGLLEPLMIVTIGAIVLIAVIALYLPVFSMSTI